MKMLGSLRIILRIMAEVLGGLLFGLSPIILYYILLGRAPETVNLLAALGCFLGVVIFIIMKMVTAYHQAKGEAKTQGDETI